MVKGLLNSCAVALVLSQALWALPASAQALPANFISPNVPHDVPAGPGATVAQLAVYAWQEFIALNWQANDPAQTGTRGRPNTNVDFLDIAPTNGSFPLVVWQTYRHKNELFPASGRADPTFDSFMPTYRYQGPSLPTPATGGPIPSFNLFNNLDETSEIGLANMYAHASPVSTPSSGIRVAYEAKVNRAIFDYANNMAQDYTNPASINGQGTKVNAATINTGPVYTGDGRFAGICSAPPGAPSIVMLPCAGVTYPWDAAGEGAIEVKAAWRALDPTKGDILSHYFTRNVIFYTGPQANQKYNNAVWGLVALHIIHKTKSFPNFVFASWEQVENYDDATPANSQNLAYQNIGLPNGTPLPNFPVTRAHAIHSQVAATNTLVQAAFKAGNPNTIWQYYKLIGVQGAPKDGPPPATASADDLSYYYMANIMVETNVPLQNFTGSISDGLVSTGRVTNIYFPTTPPAITPPAPVQMGGCQGCHGFQGQFLGGDMSPVFAGNFPNASLAESIDVSDANAGLTYFHRRIGLARILPKNVPSVQDRGR